jgi:hypothetical protein
LTLKGVGPAQTPRLGVCCTFVKSAAPLAQHYAQRTFRAGAFDDAENAFGHRTSAQRCYLKRRHVGIRVHSLAFSIRDRRVMLTPHGRHSKTSLLASNARQIVRTRAMGLEHDGQRSDPEFSGCLDLDM